MIRNGFNPLVPAFALITAGLPACTETLSHSPRSATPAKTFVPFGTKTILSFPGGTKVQNLPDSHVGKAKMLTLGGVYTHKNLVFIPGDRLFFRDDDSAELYQAITVAETIVDGVRFPAGKPIDLRTSPSKPKTVLNAERIGPFFVRPPSIPLGPNPNNAEQYVTEKSEKDGLKELKDACVRSSQTLVSELEEAWYFVEAGDAQKKTVSLWFEAGIDETPGSVKTSTDSSLAAIAFVLSALNLNAVEKVAHVHYHPTPYIEKDWREWGTLYPSTTDLGEYNYEFEKSFRDSGLGKHHEKYTVTRAGVWRMRWTGESPSPANEKSQRTLLNQYAQRAWAKVKGMDGGDNDTHAFMDAYSNGLTRLSFEKL